MVNSYFDYMVYLAIKMKFEYGESNEVTLDEFRMFRMNVTKNIREYYDSLDLEDMGFEWKLEDFTKFNDELTPEAEEKLLSSFVKKNNKFVLFENDKMIFTGANDRAIKALRLRVENYTDNYDEILSESLDCALLDLDNLEILNATAKVDTIRDIYEKESRIEYLYETKQIESPEIVLNRGLITNKLRELYDNSSVKDFNGYLNLIKLFMAQKDLKVDTYDIFFDAIFLKKELALYKMYNSFKALEFMKQESMTFEKYIRYVNSEVPENYLDFDNDTYDLDPTDDYSYLTEDIKESLEKQNRINNLFYTEYIKLLDDYQKYKGSSNDLALTKNRLLYVLDPFFERALKYEIDKDDFKTEYYTAIRFIPAFSKEIDFKKFLYIFTYYNLTNDKRIKKEIKESKASKLFDDLKDLESKADNMKKKLVKKNN